MGKAELALGQNGVLKVPFGTISENEINCVDGRNSQRSGHANNDKWRAVSLACVQIPWRAWRRYRGLRVGASRHVCCNIAAQSLTLARACVCCCCSVSEPRRHSRQDARRRADAHARGAVLRRHRVGAVASIIVRFAFAVPQDIRHQATILHAHR